MIYYKAVWAFLPFGFERKNGMIVLGIDPGYAIVGYGVVEMKNNRYRTLEHGAVTTKAGTDFNRRLEIIYDGIAQVLAQYHPDAISVEKLYFSTIKRPASVWRKPVASFCLRRRRPACLFLNTPPCR